MTAPIVHLVCGLNGAGKTTLAKRLEAEGAIRFSLDAYMIAEHPGLRYDAPEYGELRRLAIEELRSRAEVVLRDGRSVVLDWNHWNRALRADSIRWAAEFGAEPVVHWVDVPVERAITQAQARDDPHSHRLDVDHVRQLASIFEPPTPGEGVEIIRH